MESFPQPVDDYFVEPPQAEEEEEEEEKRVPPPSSHTPVMISKGELVSLALITICGWGGCGAPPGVTWWEGNNWGNGRDVSGSGYGRGGLVPEE